MADTNNLQTYINFYSNSFWNNFYRGKEDQTFDWYFDLTKLNLDEFSLYSLSKESSILEIGIGLSNTLKFFDDNKFEYIDVIDFSEPLIKRLESIYSKNENWSFFAKNVIEPIKVNEDEELTDAYDVIIDKGCIDCILSDPDNAEQKFKKALNNLMKYMKADGKFFYFSYAKIADRVNLFYDVSDLKYKCVEIPQNKIIKEEFKEFNDEDNCYTLFILEKTSKPMGQD